jgi:hypothetical protein
MFGVGGACASAASAVCAQAHCSRPWYVKYCEQQQQQQQLRGRGGGGGGAGQAERMRGMRYRSPI